MFITIRSERHYLWRGADQDGDVIDILVTKRRDRQATKRFFCKALKHQGKAPWQLVTDKLRAYRAAHWEVFPSVVHRTGQYENNRAEVSPQHTREREKQMRRFKSPPQCDRNVSTGQFIYWKQKSVELLRVGTKMEPNLQNWNLRDLRITVRY